MKDTYLYFRAVADEDNDDGDGASSSVNPTSIAIPTRNITGIAPASDTTVAIKFLSVRNQGPRGGQAGASGDEIIQDTITLGVNTHRHQGVIDTIIRAMNNVHSDGFIDVCDDVTTLFGDSTISAVRLHGDITGIADTGISVAAAM
jgi:hypothetical protein|tara:strand:- start:357 stop:794 length:438 start_codon:yes stop_codon:yes gene_type:complete